MNAKNCDKVPFVEQKITRLGWKGTMYSVVKLSSYFWVLYFMSLYFLFIYIINIRYWQVRFITLEQLGKFQSVTSNFKCRASARGPLQLYLFFCVFLIKQIKVFIAEKTSGLHERGLLKYHESFPVLVFEGNLSI